MVGVLSTNTQGKNIDLFKIKLYIIYSLIYLVQCIYTIKQSLSLLSVVTNITLKIFCLMLFEKFFFSIVCENCCLVTTLRVAETWMLFRLSKNLVEILLTHTWMKVHCCLISDCVTVTVLHPFSLNSSFPVN